MPPTTYLFTTDLRLDDNPAFARACADAATLVPTVALDPSWFRPSPLGFPLIGPHRAAFMLQAIIALRGALQARGSDLNTVIQTSGVLPRHADPAQSMMLHPDDLPFATPAPPMMFTVMRQRIERAGVRPRPPLPAPERIPPLPDNVDLPPTPTLDDLGVEALPPDSRSSFPYMQSEWEGGEDRALAYARSYLRSGRAHTYKQTRNGLAGTDFSSKWSPWLALGAVSARRLIALLQDAERDLGANDSTYWLWFELLWRDYFRLYSVGDAPTVTPTATTEGFDRWRSGTTGQPLVDAAMRELAATGFMSNRMRQIVASYLVHDLHGDWRMGERWFASMLIDYDPWSNMGNWQYVAGIAFDPRGGRRFDPIKQSETYDPDGAYRRLWGTA
jgi:deoxyribodipyrimidine photo-lyase